MNSLMRQFNLLLHHPIRCCLGRGTPEILFSNKKLSHERKSQIVTRVIISTCKAVRAYIVAIGEL